MKTRLLFLCISLLFLMTLACATCSNAKILIVAPHPDDEALMFSGIIYSAVSRGEPVKLAVITNGDLNGVNIGNSRQDETVAAMVNTLGMQESDIMFLGYPDAGLASMYSYYLTSSAAYMAANGQSTTYGHRGLGNSDYHYYKRGAHAYYNKPNILNDLITIINEFQPDHIFMTSEYDPHPDHSIAHTVIVEALSDISNSNPGYKPIIHKTIIHGGADSQWPLAKNAATLFTPPPLLSSTPLNWTYRESVNLPLIMQNDVITNNLKYNTILKYSSQLKDVADPQNNFLTNFVHKDEIFWAENIYSSNSPPVANAGQDKIVTEGELVFLNGDSSIDPDGTSLTYKWTQLQGTPVTLSNTASSAPSFTAQSGLNAAEALVFQLIVHDGQIYSFPVTVTVTVLSSSQYGNIAGFATATASSQKTSTLQLASKVIDGVIDGCPSNCAAEWTTTGELTGAWIKLSWPQSLLADKIVLYDRPDLNEQILSATLTFSDGSTVNVGPLTNSGSGDEVKFPARKFNWLMVTVNQASGANTGLAELQVFGNRFPSLAVTTLAPRSGTTGTPYSQALAATGGVAPYSWSVTSGTLPGGLSLNSATGVVSGTPATQGTSTVTVKVQDAGQATATRSLKINIYVPPVITVTSLPAGDIDTDYSHILAASGGQLPYTWSVSAGSLPAGLTINPSTGTISGIPSSAGTASFTVKVKDAASATAVKALAITVHAPLTISTDSLVNGFSGTAYSAAVDATGGLTPYVWTVSSGSLPAGLTLEASSGIISGTPSVNGISTFTLQVKDAQLTTVTKLLSITISVNAVSLFSDDFTRAPGAPAPLSPWTGVLGTWTAANGVLQGSGSAYTYSQIYYAPDPLWDNYAVEGRFQMPSSAFGGGIGCRVNPVTGAQYSAWIFPDNSIGGRNVLKLGKLWSWSTFSGTTMAESALPSVGTGFHTLKMVCDGTRIQVYYDGALKIDVVDNNFDSRPPYVTGGISAALFTAGSVYTMTVDNVVVSSLGGNSPPVAVNDTYGTTVNNTLNQAAPGVLGNDSAPEGGTTLTARLMSGPSHGTLTLNSDGSFVYAAVANYVGSDSFTYRATDGTTSSSSATVTISVTSAGGVLFSDDFTRVSGAPAPLSPWTKALGAWTVTNGVLQGSGSALSYSQIYYAPAPFWDNYAVEGRVQFPSTAFGGGIGCRVNPATGAQYSAWIFPDNSGGGRNVLKLGKLWSWSSFSGTAMAEAILPAVGTGYHLLKVVCNGTRIQVFFDGISMIDVTDNNYDSRAPYLTGGIGAGMFTNSTVYTMSVDNVVVSRLDSNEIPAAVNDTYSTNANTTLNRAAPGVLSNDSDPEGATLTAQLVSGPSHGSLTLAGNGSFVYTPATDYVGSDSFTYRASDGVTSSIEATVTITVVTALSSLSLNPATVRGGTASVGTVTLSVPAPSGGVVVMLSDNSTSATVPANVTVSSGSSNATFNVSTSAVTRNRSATISAVYGGITKKTTLNITL